MSLLVVGSTALDTLQTPFGKRKNILGGSAIYFSFSARAFGPVRLVSVVGRDFPGHYRRRLTSHNIDHTGLQIEPGKTFRWHGCYVGDMCSARTISVHLNTFGSFRPVLPKKYQDTKYLFLANGHPLTQESVLRQIKRPKLIFCDTMNYWIENEPKALRQLLRRIDGLIVNNDEVRQLTGEVHIVKAARELLKWGPKILIIKKGEHGALLITKNLFFAVPGYPIDIVRDPTGAGDSFAGGLMGYLARSDSLSVTNLKKALLYGTVMASFTIEKFGVDRLKQATFREATRRLRNLYCMMRV
ncbi:PfkB family carbohydrate kinase [Planctomycetota bacterium]